MKQKDNNKCWFFACWVVKTEATAEGVVMQVLA
jgi:hypothetical protein